MRPEEIMRKAAEYVRVTQPRLAEFKAQRDSFVKGASAAARKLAEQGLIARNSIATFVEKAAEDPSSVWPFVEKLASSITVDPLGSAAPADVSSASSLDPWEARLFPELARGYGQVTD